MSVPRAGGICYQLEGHFSTMLESEHLLYHFAEETCVELGQEGHYSFYAQAAHWLAQLRQQDDSGMDPKQLLCTFPGLWRGEEKRGVRCQRKDLCITVSFVQAMVR